MPKISIKRSPFIFMFFREINFKIGNDLYKIGFNEVKSIELPPGKFTASCEIDWLSSNEVNVAVSEKDNIQFTISPFKGFAVLTTMSIVCLIVSYFAAYAYAWFGLAVVFALPFLYYFTINKNSYFVLEASKKP